MSGVSLAQGVVATGTQSLSTSLSSLSTSTSTGINSLSTSTSTGINSLSTAIGGGGGGVPSYLGVGWTQFAIYAGSGALANGASVAGSDLYIKDTYQIYAWMVGVPVNPPAAADLPTDGGTTLAGTWRAMQALPSLAELVPGGYGSAGGFFMRIA